MKENTATESSEFPQIYSLNSESFNNIKIEKSANIKNKDIDQSSELTKKDSFSELNISNIDIPPINIPNSDYKKPNNININIGKSKTDFILRKYSSSSLENKRYEDNMDEIYNDNIKFFSFIKDEYNEEDEDIVNNEISSRYSIEENKDINKYDSGELKSQNINIYSKTSDNNISYEYSNSSDDNKINQSKTNIKDHEKEILIKIEKNINEKAEQNKKNNIDLKNNIQNKNIENIDKQKTHNINSNENMNMRRTKKFMNMTKQKKIFQKFLSVSVDTSCLYSLDDDMKILILNPKIIYNYPYNKKERELE
jgi:hypothetical protein